MLLRLVVSCVVIVSDFSGFDQLGLYEFDPDGSKARALEGATGIRVIRHRKCFCFSIYVSLVILRLCNMHVCCLFDSARNVFAGEMDQLVKMQRLYHV